MSRLVVILSLLCVLPGCAGFKTSGDMRGLEIYRPAICLVVAKETATAFTCPNLESKYAIKPQSFLAKNEFTIELTDGMVSKVTDTLDTTAILTFLKDAAELGAKLAKPVSEQTVKGDIGLAPGFYIWDGGSTLRKMAPPSA